MSNPSRKNDEIPTWAILVGIIALGAYCQRESGNETSDRSFDRASFSVRSSISRDDALSEYWNEIKEYATGSEVVEACSESGCYDLHAEISNGALEIVHFPNGGYLMIAADIDQDGNASDVDQRGRIWDFTLDMESSVVDQAIQKWAVANKRRID
jgi:hypothetical protein